METLSVKLLQNLRPASIALTFGLLVTLPTSVSRQAVTQTVDHTPAALSPQELFKRVSHSVFIVEVVNKRGSLIATGSGVAMESDKVVTNNHVIKGGASLRIRQGDRTWPAHVTHVDSYHDLCLLTVEGLKAPVVPVRLSSVLTVGERVYSIGAPEGLELTISEGLISGLREFKQARIIQTSAAISHGSSGGGLFDAQGQLVGITSLFLKEGQNLNFALPGEWVLALTSAPVLLAEKNKIATPASQVLFWYQLGIQMLDAGNYEVALYAFREVVRLEPGLSEACVNLGLTYDHLHQYDKAIPAFEEAIRLKPDLSGAWNGLGFTYMQLHQYDKALPAFQEAIRLKPDDVTAWNNLGLIYDLLHQYDKAIPAFQEAIRLKPDLSGAWFGLGGAYDDLHQYEKALPAYQEAIRLKPDDNDAWRHLGIAYERSQQHDKAVSALQEAIRLKPGENEVWKALAVAYDNSQQYDKAVSALQEAIRLEPGDNRAWYGLGEVYDDLHQYDKAIPAFLETVRLKPDYATAWYKLGIAYSIQGDRSRVMTVYEKLKTLDPNLADDFLRKTAQP
jgi:tetratricopeptide (TPR) repeat protein